MKHAQSSTKYVVNLVAAFNGAGEHLKPTADAFQTTVAFCDDGAFQWQTEEVDMDRNLRKAEIPRGSQRECSFLHTASF